MHTSAAAAAAAAIEAKLLLLLQLPLRQAAAAAAAIKASCVPAMIDYYEIEIFVLCFLFSQGHSYPNSLLLKDVTIDEPRINQEGWGAAGGYAVGQTNVLRLCQKTGASALQYWTSTIKSVASRSCTKRSRAQVYFTKCKSIVHISSQLEDTLNPPHHAAAIGMATPDSWHCSRVSWFVFFIHLFCWSTGGLQLTRAA
jgi:hypothetical protein